MQIFSFFCLLNYNKQIIFIKMQSKLILVLAALLALSSVNAQGDGGTFTFFFFFTRSLKIKRLTHTLYSSRS